uniref:Uncharacterized protein n=1 Tax=Ditylenchus dipsaci TaxID=166011 RepID=A0A915CSS3_9BILA
MFCFGACCSKLLILLYAISLLEIVLVGDDAVPSIFSDAFGDDNHLLMDGASTILSTVRESCITLTLQKYASSAEVTLVVPEQDAITFIAIRPNCVLTKHSRICNIATFLISRDVSRIEYSYAEDVELV